ncbi:head GIN domain-containing protein [Thalassobellus sediminis]|uniref:head GIN domain-containing protein n=1 Tax=Thalassobellus sediminis TaxID=3367753 RepID=UPI00379B9F4C
MKTLVKVFILFITTVIFAQNPIEKNVGDFSELKVYDLIEVELVKSNENKAIITGDNKEDVIINNKNGTLKIKMKLEESFDGNKTKVILHYNTIDIIDVNEGAKVHSDDTIKQFEIDLKAQEGGKINVPVNVTYANIKADTGGVISVTGKSKSQNISISTGGVYEGKELKTDKTEVNIKAAGEAYVNASKLVDVKIRVGGDVFIYGDPETVNESKVLGGRIKRMD